MQRHIDIEVAEALARLKKDTEDMRYMKDKFVHVMDRAIKRMSNDKEKNKKLLKM